MDSDERVELYDDLAKSTWGGETDLDIETRLVRDIFLDQLCRYDSRVLNLGCGNFERHHLFDHFDEVVGLDIAKPALREGRGRDSVTAFIRGDAERLPFRKNSFDLVFTDQVIEHLPEPKRTLSEIQRIGDTAIICVPNDALETQRLVNWLRGFDPENEIGHLHSNQHNEWRKLISNHIDIRYERGIKLFNILAMPALSFLHGPIAWLEQRVSLPRWSYYSLFEGPTK